MRIADVTRSGELPAVASPADAHVVAEGGGWSVVIPGVPIAADGATFDEALVETVEALREYAEDWRDHLLDASNHQDHWALVQRVMLSDDAEPRAWLLGGEAGDERANETRR
ncbi:hypothetical protein J4H86_25160 [Spiractinospora alimapuensis]|uniref:hypothetical protein n=1 Tax=Spiractinospora alimapuensis TaxID=2820884 RepID=UPI001F26EFB4|nr:hypothetical protein [Spiractinospora alimapuensis]QVQ51987.1 hypothetical protein J4H86_25160 [Spiractinospora alimapuensis]